MLLQNADIAGSRVRIGYVVELNYDVVTPSEFIFNVHAARTPHQRVVAESFAATPQADVAIDEDPAFGNRLARMHAEPGALAIRYAGTVEVSHYMAEPALLCGTPLAELPTRTLLYLRPSRYCQADRVQSMAWQEFGGLAPGYGQAAAVCAWVRERTRFQPGTSGVNTSALETLNERVGVCRDFAHLAIALLRAQLPGPHRDRRRRWRRSRPGPARLSCVRRGVPERPLVSVRSNRHFAAHWADPHRNRHRRRGRALRHDVRRCPHDDAENLVRGGAGP
jgi:hypothetical protein